MEPPEVEANFAKIREEDPDEYCRERINDGLFEKGMFDDLVYEGADSPHAMDPDFRAPHGNENKRDLDRWEWRVHGVFIVAAQTARDLRQKICDLENAFDVGDANRASMEIAFRRDGQTRPGNDRGKEQYGALLQSYYLWTILISQLWIRGLYLPTKDPRPG